MACAFFLFAYFELADRFAERLDFFRVLRVVLNASLRLSLLDRLATILRLLEILFQFFFVFFELFDLGRKKSEGVDKGGRKARLATFFSISTFPCSACKAFRMPKATLQKPGMSTVFTVEPLNQNYSTTQTNNNNCIFLGGVEALPAFIEGLIRSNSHPDFIPHPRKVKRS